MTNDKVQVLVVGLLVFVGSSYFLAKDGFSLTIAWFAVLGFAGIVIGGWPIWSKWFKKN